MNAPRPDPDAFLPTRASLLKRLERWEDQESWRAFFDTYWRLIYSWAVRRGLEDADAQEVVQQTVLKVAGELRAQKFSYDPKVCSFKTWLRRVADSKILDEFRRRQRHGGQPRPSPAEDSSTEPPGQGAVTPPGLEAVWDEEWERNLLAAAAERVKRRVSLRNFQIFEYHVLQGHGVRETARHLDTSVAQVYLVNHRIAPLMRKEVEALREEPM